VVWTCIGQFELITTNNQRPEPIMGRTSAINTQFHQLLFAIKAKAYSNLNTSIKKISFGNILQFVLLARRYASDNR
jgi:hypothetical protein